MVQFSCLVVSDSLRPHGVQHARPPGPSPTPGVYSDSCPLSWWCHPTISSSLISSSCRQSFPASGSFPVSRLFASGDWSCRALASESVLPMNIQSWFPLGLTGLISLLSSSVQFSCSVVFDSLWPHGLQHSRPPCPSPTPGDCSNSCPLSRWSHPTISSSVIPFSSWLQSFPASHQGLVQWVSSSHQAAKDLELHLQHQSFHWIFRNDLL